MMQDSDNINTMKKGQQLALMSQYNTQNCLPTHCPLIEGLKFSL